MKEIIGDIIGAICLFGICYGMLVFGPLLVGG